MTSVSEEAFAPHTSPLNPQSKPFRFKRKRSPSISHSSDSPTHSQLPHRRRHHRRHHHHHRRSQRHTDRPPDAYDNKDTSMLNPDDAFRESLFDALADDEGAAYWEGVYGQPIHTYSPFFPQNGDDDRHDPEKPHLERMSDEEYIQYVRTKMWEKSHGYIIEERKRREAERKNRRAKETESMRWQRDVEDALKRGEERRQKRSKEQRWKGVWDRYISSWEQVFEQDVKSQKIREGAQDLRERISWPVESGRWEDVSKEEVERFFKFAPDAAKSGGDLEIGELMKRERVRWHPDKMQQRAKGEGIDDGTMKIITAVFQILDRLWAETKDKR